MTTESYSGNPYRGIRVAVLGASGFIGRWVARALCAQEAEVFLVVRDTTAAEAAFRGYQIHGDIVELDLGNPQALPKLYRQAAPSITFNLACYGVDASERDAAAAYRINSDLIQALCAAAQQSHQSDWSGLRLVHVGSALEYGANGGDVSEDATANPTTAYGRSKLAGTSFLSAYCQTHGLQALTARLFTVYGPGEHRGRLLPILLEAAGTGNPLCLTAGRQQRDFIFVADAAEALLRLGVSSARPGEIVNVATGRLTPVRVFVETAATVLGIPSDGLRFGALSARPEEMWHSEVPVERLLNLTAWVPRTGIAEGITRTLEFERNGRMDVAFPDRAESKCQDLGPNTTFPPKAPTDARP